MAFEFFTNALEIGALQSPNDQYRDAQQAFINQQWDNTSAMIVVEEQDYFGAKTFHKIEAWINKTIGVTTTFMKNGEDFRQLLFRDIDKKLERGLLYRFEDNYWLADFVNPSQGLAADVSVRRCNNWLRIVDPENGAIYTEPCVVDYDMTSPSVQVSSYLITPNNHAIVIVQANDDTRRLFKYNTRYMLGGRPFKLYAYQNALLKNIDVPVPTVLYLDLYLDELHAEDSIENQLADNGRYDYAIKIQSSNSLQENSTGQFDVDIVLNGVETSGKQIVWKSSDCNIISVNKQGEYEVKGAVGDTAEITAMLYGNSDVVDTISIEIVAEQQISPVVYINPAFSEIRQFESIEFDVTATVTPTLTSVSLSPDEEILANEYIEIVSLGGTKYQASCLKISSEPIVLYIKASGENPVFESTAQIQINTVSMFG